MVSLSLAIAANNETIDPVPVSEVSDNEMAQPQNDRSTAIHI